MSPPFKLIGQSKNVTLVLVLRQSIETLPNMEINYILEFLMLLSPGWNYTAFAQLRPHVQTE